MGGACPWVGYDMFKDEAIDGSYTFDATNDPKNPTWCFTPSS